MDEQTFWSKTEREQRENGCWLWSGCKSRGGYGHVHFNKKTWRANRLAWFLTHGEIPSRMVVMHLCNNPSCINPDHLKIGTQSENIKYAYQCNPEPFSVSPGFSNPKPEDKEKEALERFWSNVEKCDDCWLWIGYKSGGYGHIKFLGQQWKAHRLSWSLVNGPIPKEKYILHKCDVPLCVNPSHLYPGTQSDNLKDAHRRGRYANAGQPPGEKHAMARLTKEQVCTIHRRLEVGETHETLADEYSVTQGNISCIANGKSWKHLNLEKIPMRQGSQRPAAKLTEKDIPVIVARIKLGESIGKVAKDYGMGRTAIWKIWNGKSWKHVPRD